MKTRCLPCVCAQTILLLSAFAAGADVPLADPWRQPYAGEHATGKHVLALWTFDGKEPLADASAHKHALTLRGAATHADGRFGGCLESNPGRDAPHQAIVRNHPALSPGGPFTIEMWIRPRADFQTHGDCFLLDKKYVAPIDYQLILRSRDKTGLHVLEAALGFGSSSSSFHSRPFKLEPLKWRHVAFTYDAAGRGSFFLDGRPWGSQLVEGRKGVSPGSHNLVIGDRIGSYYHGFAGWIDQVRLCSGVREFRPLRAEMTSTRAVFLRMEKASVALAVTNLRAEPLGKARATLSLEGHAEQAVPLEGLGGGQTRQIDYALDTSLRPGEYELRVRVDLGDEPPLEEALRVRIVGRPCGGEFPVVMWGGYSPESLVQEMGRLKRIGFTHVLGLGADSTRIWEAGKVVQAGSDETVTGTRRALDEALANGIRLAASLSPASRFRGQDRFARIGPDGKPNNEAVCAAFGELEGFCYNVGASMARTYGDHPAFAAALLHTEVRDHARPCYHPHDLEALHKATGLDKPPPGAGRWGADYARLKNFPADRVVPDDHPVLAFSRWYWSEGDGWNRLNTALHRGLKSTGRRDLWTWHDPAVRVPSLYGSGGEADVISQWTYSYPDPIRIGLATDELLAMAGGAGSPQQVMKMTQVIWYRSQTAPQAKDGRIPATAADWEREQPDAPFITIAPMHLREAMWTKIARPIRGIMYHGWQSLVPCDGHSSYRCTNLQTQDELARLVREVIRPLGPTLLKVPAARPDVAFLESFASQMLARRGTWGWGGSWAGDAWHVLAWARLQSEIVYDQTIARRGLDGYRVLVACDCDVLSQTAARRIREFQQRGGLVIGDENLCPAIKPDIVLPLYKRTGRADADKAALLERAAGLRRQLDGRYRRAVDTSNPEVIPCLRAAGASDYVFLVNDRREYGQYVGRHGIVMENGLPSKATLRLARAGGHVYDLVRSRALPSRQEGDHLCVDVELGPCDGKLLLVAPRPIEQVRVEAPPELARGQRGRIVVTVADAEGKAIDAVVPIELAIRDSEGRLAEFSGYHAAVAGRLDVPLEIAPNDCCGVWQVEVRERASGRCSTAYVRVPPPPGEAPATRPAPTAADAVQPNG